MECRKCHKSIPDESVFCMFCGAKQTRDVRIQRRGNGQGSVFKLPNGKYRAEVVLGYYTVNGKLRKKTVTRSFDRKVDAVNAIPDMKKTQFIVKTMDIRLIELHELYLESPSYNALSTSQKNKMTYAWNRLEPIHFRPIVNLTVDDLQRTIDSAVQTFYPARDMKIMLSHLYTIAIKREIVQYNKTEYIDLPDTPQAKKERWSADELAAFWADHEAHPFTDYILVMTYAGLRYGEMATIQIPDVHLDQHVMIGGIKTEAGIMREIPIADRILPIVTRMYHEGKYKLLEMNEDTFYQKYWATIDRLQIRHLPPQTCRHTYFSLMTAAQIQPGVIAETGGHASYLTTVKHYVTLSLSEKLAAVNQMASEQNQPPTTTV